MYIKSLKLHNFRNYEKLEIDFSRDFNILYGENAQGKTNIIEAIFLCASGRSHRTSKDAELVRLDSDGYYVKLDIEKNASDTEVEIAYKKDDKRRIRINDIPVGRIGELVGQLNVVIFSPEDLLVIKEGPAERRRFLDITLSQLRPSYFYDLQQYSKILSQRNSLLKEIQFNNKLMDTLEIWNSNLVKTGSRIIKARRAFIEKLNRVAENMHYKLTDGKEKLETKYAPSVNADDLDDIESIESSFSRKITEGLHKELQRCSTLYGPHRDDYVIFLDGMNIKQYGSQGQQRTSVLSVKLSEVDIVKEETGEYPVLLLDDVMSELDANRQSYLCDNLQDIQTLITCTDKTFFCCKNNIKASFFNVSKGSVTGG